MRSANLRFGVIWLVLGTLGKLCMVSTLFTELVEVSFVFLVLPAFEVFFSASGRACDGDVGTACPSATPFDPSAGLEGFDEEEEDNLRWWQRIERA